MTIIKGCYFKQIYEEKSSRLISGLSLPPIEKGPYRFVDCTFHPRLWSAIQQLYIPKGCETVNSYFFVPIQDS